MELKSELFKTLLRKGHSIRNGKGERKVWNMAERTLLYLTPELAKGFLNLHNHLRYKKIVVNKEIELLKANMDKILNIIGDKNFDLFDIGCGDGIKAKAFIETAGDKVSICYHPVNVSEYLINLTLEEVKKENFSNVHCMKSFVKSFEELEEIIGENGRDKDEKNVILLLDSMLASYEINDYLFRLSMAMSKGDFVIIGNGIRKGERFENLENYKSPLFNEWFIHLIRALGVEDNEVEYDARFEHGRVEAFYKFKSDKVIEHEGREINFKIGDEIVVAVLYKYYPEELEEFCDLYFDEVSLVKDADEEYALIMCKK